MKNIASLLALFTTALAAPTNPKAGKCALNLFHHRFCVPVPELNNATQLGWDWKTTVQFNALTCPIGERVMYPTEQIKLDWQPNRTEFEQLGMEIRGKTLSIGREDTPDVIGFGYGKDGWCRWNENTMAGVQGNGCGWCDRVAWVTDLDKGSCYEFGKTENINCWFVC